MPTDPMPTAPHIVIVDDEPDNFEVIELLLHREGYALSHLLSGIELLDRIQEIQPDLILLDVMMPELDGIEVCRQLKQRSEWNHIPVIMVTALSSKEDLAHCLQTGADDFIGKPVNGVELRARVRSMLRIKHQYDSLKALLRMRDDLSHMLVHDMRNRLSTILFGGQSLLSRAGLEGVNLERMKLILATGQDLNTMIDNLLTIAKMEAGHLVIQRRPILLTDLVERVCSDFSMALELNQIELVCQYPNHPLQVEVDIDLYHRLLDNLLSNAVKFSPKGSRVTVRLEAPEGTQGNTQSSARSPQAILSVLDQGPGIRDALKPQIFDRYSTGDPQAGKVQTGLGLSFCRWVAEAHGGRIQVKDNPPQGTIFVVDLG